jgi:serine/threonine protein kinase
MGLFGSLFGGGGKDRKKRLVPVDVSKRFEVRGRSGQGSMSKVFQAYDNKIGRVVALKILDKEKTTKFEERFRILGLDRPSEGEICMMLRHPNLVATYEHGITTKGEPFLSMEWIEGLGLNYLIETRSKQLDGNRINYLSQLADAVQYLHDQRFLHRDLCPRNVMINAEGLVKLIDFGLTIPYKPEFCRPGNRTGTAEYLAPEIIKRQSTDHRVDLYALGITAYELFTNQMPWEKSLSSEETLRRRMNVAARNARDVNKNLGEDLVAVLMKSIARDPEARFRSANAFKEALKGLEKQDY